MIPPAPRLLFVPVSGPGGSGEYFRCVAIANAARRRWPAAQIHFIVNRAARYAADVPYPATLIDDSPTRAVAPVIACIDAQKPDIVVFDNAGRAAQYQAASLRGAGVVYISSRTKTRWKGFRLRRMRYMDQHWVMQSELPVGQPTRWEALKLRLLPRVGMHFLPVIFDPPAESVAASLLSRLNLTAGEFVLFCPGGAGQFSNAAGAPLVFAAAAARVAATAGTRVLLVGDQAGLARAPPNFACVASLPNSELMALVGVARLTVINGGSLLLQALAQQAVCVAAPIAGDQPARIARFARLGALAAADLDVTSLVESVIELLGDAARHDGIHQRVVALAFTNGVHDAVTALARLTKTRVLAG